MKVAGGVAFICLGIALCVSGFGHAQKPAAGLASGMWSGEASSAGARSYSVTVSLDGSGAGFIEYPSMKCGGRLRFVRQNGAAYSYRETITHGQTKCTAGVVDLVPDGSQLTWIHTAGSQRVTATLDTVDNRANDDCTSCELNYDQALQACFRTSGDDRQKCQEHAEDDLHSCEGACQQ
jgi:hypothetical protein